MDRLAGWQAVKYQKNDVMSLGSVFMKRILVVALSGLLMTACAAIEPVAETEAQAPASAPAEATTESDAPDAAPTMRRRCRSVRVTGSNRPERVCEMVPVRD
jgi:hypothetical protein